MYTNTQHYGGDSHIWSSADAERLRQEGEGCTSLCEHHWVDDPGDLFHVRDVASDWQTFLQEDLVCDECAQEWLERRGLEAEQEDLDAGNWLARLVRETGVPVHPNCRSTVVPQAQDDGPADATDAIRYATTSYARYVEYGRDDGAAEGQVSTAVPQGQPATLAPSIDWSEVGVDAQVEASLDSVREATERAAEHLRDHTYEFEAEIRISEEMAEDLRKEMGLDSE